MRRPVAVSCLALNKLVPVVLAGAIMVSGPVFAAGPAGIVTEAMMVPARDPGISLYVRNKHLVTMSHFAPEKTVLFVHGSTWPSETTFDLRLDGISWMDYIALHGYDVYLVDVRGYGRSTRPRQMSEPPDRNPPFADAATAVQDVGAAVDYILTRRHIKKLDLLGWSWGTTIMAGYATSSPERVERLVLYAPKWIRETPSPIQVQGPLSAYRVATREAAFTQWMTGVPQDKKEDLIPAGWFDAWAAATFASDPVGAAQHPPVVRAPNGTLQDDQKIWSAGKATFNPAKITVPVLLIQAEWDQVYPPYMARALFPLLIHAPEKRYVMIGEGTHMVFLERNRMHLFYEVQAFLDEGATAAMKPPQ